jgi:hypothetical protein
MLRLERQRRKNYRSFLFRQFIVFMDVHNIAPGIFPQTKSRGKKL